MSTPFKYRASIEQQNKRAAELMGRTRDGAKENAQLRFRILCKRCNSYLHTKITMTRPLVEREGAHSGLLIECTKCGNEAWGFEQEFES